MFKRLYWVPAFDGEEEETEVEPKKPEITPEIQKIIDERVNQSISESQEAMKKNLEEVKALQASATMNERERKRLETSMKALSQKLMTKEQQAEADLRDREEKHQVALTEAEKDRDYWKNMYSDTSITNALVKAAVDNNAVNPEQIIAMFRHSVQIIPEVDAQGKETGKLVTVMPYIDPKADSKEAVNMPVGDVIKKLADRDEYANLFKDKGFTGLHRKSGGAGDVDMAKLARDNPAKFRELAKKGQKL